MITKEQYKFLKERLKDAKREKPECTANSTYSGDDLVCNICPLYEFEACPCKGKDSIKKITELMKEYEENNMSAEGVEITKEDYNFLKWQKQYHDSKRFCIGASCDDCILDMFACENNLDYGSCCPAEAEFMAAYTALSEQYEKENSIKKEDKMGDETKTAEKHNEPTNQTENYYDKLQRYYKKDFRVGDRVFVKPQEDCKETEEFRPNRGKFGEIITIKGFNYYGDSDELYFYESNEPYIEYAPEWLLPVVSPEDAYRAMLDGKTITGADTYDFGRKFGGITYNQKEQHFITSLPCGVDFIILDEPAKLTITKQEIADKFGVDIKDLIIKED